MTLRARIRERGRWVIAWLRRDRPAWVLVTLGMLALAAVSPLAAGLGIFVGPVAAVAALGLGSLLILDRHAARREHAWRYLGCVAILAWSSASVLVDGVFLSRLTVLPWVAAACVALLAACALGPLRARFFAPLLGAILALALIGGIRAYSPAARPASQQVAELPFVTDRLWPSGAPISLGDGAELRLMQNGSVLLCRGLACSAQMSEMWFGYPDREYERLSVRRLPRGWLVTRDAVVSTAMVYRPEHSVAVDSSDLTHHTFGPADLGGKLAAPPGWVLVALLGGASMLGASGHFLLRAARRRWLLRLESGTHHGDGVVSIRDTVLTTTLELPPGDVAVRVVRESSAAYRGRAVIVAGVGGTPQAARTAFVDDLAGDLASCGIVALAAATPTITAVALGFAL